MEKNNYGSNLIRVKLENNLEEVYTPVASGTIVSLFLSYFLSQYLDHFILTVWFFSLLSFGLGRLAYKKLYLSNPKKFHINTWLKVYKIIVCGVGALWGAITLLSVNLLPGQYQLIEFTLLLGMSAGGAISNISNKFIAVFYSNTIIICHIIKLFVEQKDGWESLVLVEFVFLALIYKVITKFYKIYNSSILMTFELKNKMKLEKELQEERAQKLQNAKLASLGEMAAGITHEISNPLTISIGSLKILMKLIERGDVSKEEIVKNIEVVLESNERITKIIRSMKSLSRMKEDAELELMSLKEVIESCLPLIKTSLTKNEVEFLDNTKDLRVLADRSEISQIVINLIKNSIDAIKNLEADKWIKIESIEHQEFIELRFIDSGKLADDAIKSKIFDPFFTTKDIGEGTGLGLSLCKSLMERSRGEIFLDPSSEFTCFVLCFPKPTESSG